MDGNPPIEVVKGKCKRCEVLIAVDPRWCGTVFNYVGDANGGNLSLISGKFDQKAGRLLLCEMIILDEQPFKMVEYVGFRRFCQTNCPQLQLPSRQTIRTDCVKLLLERKQDLSRFFKKEGMG
ncbi:hypothetical protein SASPL_143886 [Salvia splendens]|uniref:Uncharacterized protein n=1 Tax=Salvia splendens TaxID=180675 RepID=A0A8X8WN07_SALSN|nr:hypothetical protein SASPL_143886 [Salvia splendens]